ncbi:copper amine oxidase N-terminal domain-containing protein [Saccharibacillus brassicae]|uniref:Copper amine oxidase N-terminal domain-containing protein n=1 Tax=Saccharibacillus brassicae TaxID=2583377 RepID=A0A4Y6UQ89_SACBS|nr:copper amine oxidase N-terminal domain-containing protein [Saccharibacillus brassicae]QDH19792.1 copper amine oxidase N-terminal domain-containing protein [Saccharibacillus brassicae]
MKKYLVTTLVVCTILTSCFWQTATVSAAESSMTVKVDNYTVQFNAKPIVQQGTTMVQIAPIFKKLGITYTWDQTKKQIIAKKMDTEIIMTLGSKTVYVKGNPTTISQAPISKNGYIMVPLRFISETTGASISKVGNTINIYSLDESIVFSTGGKKVTPKLIEEYLNKTYPNVWDGTNRFPVRYEVSKNDTDNAYDIEIVFNKIEDIELLVKEIRSNRKVVENLTNSLALTIQNLFKQDELYFYIVLKMEVSEPLDVDIPAIDYQKMSNGNYLLVLPEYAAFYDFITDTAGYYLVDSYGKLELMYVTDTKWTIE